MLCVVDEVRIFCRSNKSEGMDVLKVVQQLRDLAADPQNRATIVRVSVCVCVCVCVCEAVTRLLLITKCLRSWWSTCLYGEDSRTSSEKKQTNLYPIREQ